jgi:hypothetical protein
MSTQRFIVRLFLAVTLIVSLTVMGYAMFYSPPTSEGAWAAIAAALAVVAAVIAGWISSRTLELQEDTLQPNVDIFIDGSSRYGMLQLCLRNTGGTAARKINIAWDKPIISSNSEVITFKEELADCDIEIFVPGETATMLIDMGAAFFQVIAVADYQGSLSFLNSSGQTRTQSFHLSAERFRKRLVHDEETPRTHFELQKIPAELKRIGDELQRLRVLESKNND